MKQKKYVHILIILAVLLLAGAGGYFFYTNTEPYKLRKLDTSVANLMAEQKYTEAMDLFKKAKEDGLNETEVDQRIVVSYSTWAKKVINDDQATVLDVFAVYEDMMERFPEHKEYAETQIGTMLASLIVVRGDTGLKEMEALYLAAIDRYFDSDIICNTFDGPFRDKVRAIIVEDLDKMLDYGLGTDIENKNHENVFKLLDYFNLEEDLAIARKYTSLPIPSNDYSGNILYVINATGYTTLYYGRLDSNNNRTGEGAGITHYVSDSFSIDHLIYGSFQNNVLNGQFYEVIDKTTDRTITVFNEGQMKEGRYDGDITSTFIYDPKTTAQREREYIFTFDDGVPVSKDTLQENGQTYYIVGTPADGSTSYIYLYPENRYTRIHGMLPDYNELP